jgi:hypothetical protein
MAADPILDRDDLNDSIKHNNFCQCPKCRPPHRTGSEKPAEDQVSYRGMNGRWYTDPREAKSKYSWSD